ncbi:deleted in lung and esophageal cancer protein 1 isoform X20 [Vulpes vulpes]|uniref:Deleted in lung and esophageal cancer protein 1 isoform X20 n=1 Tax=Vulpes vulpes TaxID=9627 RepID=A0ABM4XX12_VULVU
METGGAEAPQSGESGSCALGGATWTPTSPVARVRSPSESARLPSLAYSEAFHYGFGSRARRVGPPTLQPLPEPHLLRLRPTSLRTQDISHLLTGVFRNLYTNEVVGEDLSASLIKARGSEDARHEEFVDELQRIREVYKQRLDEVEMLERHIIQARARALAEKERIMQQAKVHVLENFITVPPVKSIFRWCVDSELLQKHHLISPDDYYSDTVPFCSAPKGVSIPGYSKLTFSCEKHSVPKKHLTKKLKASSEEMLTKVKDELNYTVDSRTGDLSLKGKRKTVKAGPSKNAKWMSHLHVPQRELERLLLVRMESRNRFLKNPRFFPPNTPHGGKSLLFPPKKPVLTGDFPSGDLEESCVDTPVFLAKPSIGFFTDYEIGPVYEAVATIGFVEQPPFGILPSVFELAPGQAICMEVLFLPTSLEKAEQTFIVVCDNCQIKELVTVGIGQLVALDLIYISGEESHPEPGELTDLTAQHFIRFEPENLQSTAGKQLIIRNATHVELAFHWQIMKPNLQSLMPGETYSLDSLKYHPDRETAFSILPERGVLGPHTDHEFILTFSPHEVSPFDIEPSSGQIHPLGECRVNITLEAKQCQRLQTVLELEVVNGTWSYLPVYAEVQEPFVYLQNSHVEVRNLYLGVPAKATITLINGTLLPTRFHWSKLLGHQASVCTAKVSPRRGTLGPSEERQLNLELTAHTEEELSDLALPCTVSGMKEPLVLGISGKPQGLQVAIAISMEGSDSSVPSIALWPGHLEELHLDFGSKVPLRTRMNCQLILTNHSPIQTPFTLKFEYFGSPQNSLNQKPSLPNMPPALLKTSRIREHLAKREQLNFMESMLSHGKGAAFFPHISQGTLGAHQQLSIDITGYANMWGEYWDNLICTVGDLPPAVIPVHMAVVGCPISSQRTTYYTTDQLQKEPIIRFGTQVSGGDTVTRVLRLNNSSPCDIRLDWETYTPEDREDRLLELLVFYGPPFPLRDQAGNDLSCPETPESSSSFWSSSPSNTSDSSHEAAQSAEGSDRASQKIISVVLREHDGVPADHLYCISPKQVVVPMGGSSTISISYTPMVLGPEVLHKVECVGYALGFMSLDDEAERELPGRRHRLQDFAAGPLRLDLCGYVRPAQLSMELDYGGGVEFRHQASDLIPEQPCTGVSVLPTPCQSTWTSDISMRPPMVWVLYPRAMASRRGEMHPQPHAPISVTTQVLSELMTTHHLKLTNTTEIPQYFQLLVSRPFSVSQEGASRSRRAPGPGREQGCEEDPAKASKQLVLHPQENMLVNVSFSLSLELLSYQKLPADQMLPGVDIRQHASGEKEMVFTQSLLLEYANHTTQVVPLRATVAVPELQLSTSWVDFGTCFVNQERVREVYLMNLSGCRSYWAVLMGRLGLPPTSRAGWHLVGGPAEKAGSQIPSDPRVALPHGPGPDPRCTPGMRWGKGGGNAWSCPGSCVPPSLGIGQQDPDKDLAAFRVSPNSGLLEARLVNAPPNIITLQVFFIARSSELYESTLVVEGMLGEKACTLRLRGQGSYDERYMSLHQL